MQVASSIGSLSIRYSQIPVDCYSSADLLYAREYLYFYKSTLRHPIWSKYIFYYPMNQILHGGVIVQSFTFKSYNGIITKIYRTGGILRTKSSYTGSLWLFFWSACSRFCKNMGRAGSACQYIRCREIKVAINDIARDYLLTPRFALMRILCNRAASPKADKDPEKSATLWLLIGIWLRNSTDDTIMTIAVARTLMNW